MGRVLVILVWYAGFSLCLVIISAHFFGRRFGVPGVVFYSAWVSGRDCALNWREEGTGDIWCRTHSFARPPVLPHGSLPGHEPHRRGFAGASRVDVKQRAQMILFGSLIIVSFWNVLPCHFVNRDTKFSGRSMLLVGLNRRVADFFLHLINSSRYSPHSSSEFKCFMMILDDDSNYWFWLDVLYPLMLWIWLWKFYRASLWLKFLVIMQMVTEKNEDNSNGGNKLIKWWKQFQWWRCAGEKQQDS